MTSEVFVANLTLQKVGEPRITSLGDNVKRAREINEVFAHYRDAELRAHAWNFAVERTSLPVLADAPAHGFTKQYQRPSDDLRPLQIGTVRLDLGSLDYRTGRESLYQIEGRKILTDFAAPLKYVYIKQVTDVTLWDVLFRDALATRIAFEIGERLTENTIKKQELKRDYNRSIREAVRIDAIENPPEPTAASTLELARL